MRARRLTVALVAGTAALGFLPVAQAATVAPTVEAWFQPNPSCPTPAGCLTAPGGPTAVSAFPAGTLHVGASGGRETARTYLGVPAGALAGLASAVLEVPLDTAAGSGTASPETAQVQVCLTSAPLARVEGSFAEPPKTDCTRSAPAAYVAAPAPHLEADLGPLLDGLGAATGLVLLPDAEALEPGDSWRVVFSSREREGGTAPATLTVERAATAEAPAPDAPAPPVEPLAPAAPQPFADAPVADLPPAPELEPELGSPPVPVDTLALPEAPATAGEQPLPVQQVGFPETVRVGYAYPGVWLLPLGLLVVVPLVARTLTRDLTPRDDDRDRPGS